MLDRAAYETRVDELDRLLNDPDTRMDPARVWNILAELAAYDTQAPENPTHH